MSTKKEKLKKQLREAKDDEKYSNNIYDRLQRQLDLIAQYLDKLD